MRCAVRGNLSRQRSRLDALRASVIAHPVVVHNRRVIDDRPVVNRRDVNVADVGYGTVVVEVVALPVSALIAAANVAKAVVYAAVESDVAPPVAMAESVTAAIETPVAGSPKRPLIRRSSPCAGHPVVSVGRIAPIARGPEIPLLRDWRLLVIRQRRRRFRSIYGRCWSVAGISIALVVPLAASLVIAALLLLVSGIAGARSPLLLSALAA
jgi:hypothetical protein